MRYLTNFISKKITFFVFMAGLIAIIALSGKALANDPELTWQPNNEPDIAVIRFHGQSNQEFIQIHLMSGFRPALSFRNWSQGHTMPLFRHMIQPVSTVLILTRSRLP